MQCTATVQTEISYHKALFISLPTWRHNKTSPKMKNVYKSKLKTIINKNNTITFREAIRNVVRRSKQMM